MYNSLLENVKQVQRLGKYLNFPQLERKLITLLLSNLKEGIVNGHFKTIRKFCYEVELIEIDVKSSIIYVYTRHKNKCSQISAIKMMPNEHIDVNLIINFMKELGLRCELITRNLNEQQIKIIFALKPQKGAP